MTHDEALDRHGRGREEGFRCARVLIPIGLSRAGHSLWRCYGCRLDLEIDLNHIIRNQHPLPAEADRDAR